MAKIQLTPLDEELLFLRANRGGCFGSHREAGDAYKEFTGKIIELALSNIIEAMPVGRYCIAGGVFRSVFYNELPKDIDIFLLGTKTEIEKNMETISNITGKSTVKVRTKYSNDIVKHIRIITCSGGRPYEFQFLGQWFELPNGKEIPFQSAEDVLETFDLVSSCYGIDLSITDVSRFSGQSKEYEVNHVVTHPLLLKTVATKELMVNTFGSEILKRMRADRFYKYITEYGFRIKDDEQLKKFNYVLGRENDVESDYS